MRIASDLDGVCADFVNWFLKGYINPLLIEHGKRPLREKDIRDFSLEKAVPLPSKLVWDTFHRAEKEGLYENLNICKNGVAAALRRLHAAGHELYYITVRKTVGNMQTYKWLDKKNMPFANGVYFASTGMEKGELCRMLGIDLMIEDNFSNSLYVAPHVGLSLLLDRPWNRRARSGVQLPENYGIIKNGKQLEEYVNEHSKS